MRKHSPTSSKTALANCKRHGEDDIETASEVIEGGLDKRSSLDSIQQAIFASTLTGKKPAVAIYDSDGNWGK